MTHTKDTRTNDRADTKGAPTASGVPGTQLGSLKVGTGTEVKPKMQCLAGGRLIDSTDYNALLELVQNATVDADTEGFPQCRNKAELQEKLFEDGRRNYTTGIALNAQGKVEAIRLPNCGISQLIVPPTLTALRKLGLEDNPLLKELIIPRELTELRQLWIRRTGIRKLVAPRSLSVIDITAMSIELT